MNKTNKQNGILQPRAIEGCRGAICAGHAETNEDTW